MKKLFFVIAIALMMVGQAKAQEVANEIKRISKAVVDDPKQDVQVRRVAYFKVNAVDYMKMKIRDIVAGNPKDKEAINKNIKMLNEQAYAMYEFVNLYIKQLAEAKTPESKDLVGKEFCAASLNNPLFNDTDLEVVQSYVNNDTYLTRFSLDTNWVKALEEVKNN